MNRVAMIVLVCFACCRYLAGQTSSEDKQPTQFEVVSIRPVSPESVSGFAWPAGTEFRVHAMQLSVLIQMAFGINPNQMVIPEWTQGRKFDIAAKTGSGVPLSYEQMKPLLQKLLVDRFGMTYHHETQPLQGYDLITAKGGVKMPPAAPQSSQNGQGRPGAIDLPNTTMKGLAAMLAVVMKRPVADKTNVTGAYEVKLRFATDEEVNPTLPSITTALQEQLGLKLTSAKVPVDMVVIDHLEKMPTEN